MTPKSGHDIIVIGASAGGVEALTKLVGALPTSLPAAVFVVLHVSPNLPSLLPIVFNYSKTLPATQARDGEAIEFGHIYVAPPDHHLLMEEGAMRLSRGPKENFSRPAIDVLFRSAAHTYGPRVVGVVLSGLLHDGTAGLIAIKSGGGIAIVQDPDEAMFAGMPRSAISRDHPDYILPLAEVAATLVRLAREHPQEKKQAHAEPE